LQGGRPQVYEDGKSQKKIVKKSCRTLLNICIISLGLGIPICFKGGHGRANRHQADHLPLIDGVDALHGCGGPHLFLL
jgi:hypothetical protein